ncbi:DEAD-box ATP-dependent RNA helicase 31 [Beta vulgaris subsp. vulgaris]|uniref:DEAD-box ATP-dependent RNA helicase 31 n=1 Tax=Beta vulgaris subsp. vulgaris TaxID=3555 RepID=UPI002036BF87|nr:DEAD-box ATP-dependent RNA helicase 31 [Beta vulgaris subsp. vulgaris]
MPVRPLPPLRSLLSPLPMSFNSIHNPSSSIPTFRRIFPLKLKYLGLGLGFPPRNFSTRPFKSRSDSGPKYPREMVAKAASTSKSLIEDEDELSNWVSGLRTGSFKSGVFTDDEENVDRGLGKKWGSEGQVSKRGRESNNVPSSTKDSPRFGRRFGGEDEGREKRMRGNEREFGTRGGRGGGGIRGGGRIGREGVRGNEREFGGRNSRGVGGGVRGGGRIGREREFVGREGVKGKEREFGERNVRGGGGSRGGGKISSVEVGGGKRGAFVSEEEEDEVDELEFRKGKDKSVSGFLDLIDEDDSDEDIDDDDEEVVIRSRSSLFANEGEKPSSGPSSSDSVDTYLSETRFDQCAVSDLSLKAIRDAGYEKLTMVQAATLPVILKGKDVMAKAKTGTGKTVAFLLPSIEVVINTPPAGRDQKRPPILVLVICPTRELASQAAAEANKLLKYHSSIGVQVVIGGTRLAVEQKRMQANPCQILVATPGRLRDHVENTAGFATRLMGVKVLVLDEADHLLDMGFRKDIERIVAAVPKQRQTLLFSATVPDEVRQISHIALKRDHEFISTVQEGSEETHAQVRQMHLAAALENQFPLLYTMLREHISDDVNYKVLVFCTTAMVTKLVADLLGELNLNVREIHSRKPQSYRTRVSDEFRKSKGLILVTSDVSARGVDYPDVTLVIQLGVPSDREQYIHRLGRTGRKGKQGQGILVLAPWEEFFLSSIKDLPITKATTPMIDPDIRKKVQRALAQVEMKNKEAAYQAWLGYYNSTKNVGRDKTRLVELANEFSRSMGLDTPPAIAKMVLGKMGLKNVPGLRIK